MYTMHDKAMTSVDITVTKHPIVFAWLEIKRYRPKKNPVKAVDAENADDLFL